MSASFTFDFPEDDNGESSENKASRTKENLIPGSGNTRSEVASQPPQLLSLSELLASLPESLSYRLEDAPFQRNGNETSLYSSGLARREHWDIRNQFMAESDPANPPELATALLSTDDILPNIYEGGFKTWECSVDLAQYLDRELQQGRLNLSHPQLHVIEMGAGTALPSRQLLRHCLPSTDQERNELVPQSLSLIVADFNAPVLTLASFPNLYLSIQSSQGNWLAAKASDKPTDGELEIDSEKKSSCESFLQARNITIQAISGPWSPRWLDLVSPSIALPGPGLAIIMASETIYTQSSTRDFAETLLALLRRLEGRGLETVALVAAKRMYFGTGGSVDDFVNRISSGGGQADMVWDSAANGVGGVQRYILSIALASR